MQTLACAFFYLLLLAAPVAAQVTGVPGINDLMINGQGSGETSCISALLPFSSYVTLDISTAPSADIIVMAAATCAPAFITIDSTYSLDLDPLTLGYIIDGTGLFQPTSFTPFGTASPSGDWHLSVNNTSTRGFVGLQAAMVSPSFPIGIGTSQAYELGLGYSPLCPPGGTPTNLVQDDGSLHITLADHSFSFYGVAYTDFYINSNGNITFGSGDSGFTETASAMLSGPPRIAAAWTDLAPNAGGVITFDEDLARIRISYLNVPGFGMTEDVQVCLTLEKHTGRIRMSYGEDNQLFSVAGEDVICGISPGGNLGAQDALDLNAPGYNVTTAANNAAFQWLNNVDGTWDLGGSTVIFQPAVQGTIYRVGTGPTIGYVSVPANPIWTSGDDMSTYVPFPNGALFSFYGVLFTGVYLNSNGNLTFGGPDTNYSESISGMLNGLPRIAGAWDDIDINTGVVGTSISGDEITFSFWNVSNWFVFTPNQNRFSMTLNLADGRITMGYGADNQAWNGCGGTSEVICGISPGYGLGQQDAFDLSSPGIDTATAPSNGIFQYLNAQDGCYDLDARAFTFIPGPQGDNYTLVR